MNTKIIGLSGTFAAGKDTLAQYLVDEYGFVHISTSDILREDTARLYGNTDRPTLYKHANELRENHGGGVLVEMSHARFVEQATKDTPGVVISGIRSIGEVEELQKHNGSMLFVDADPKVRYERAFARKRDVEATMSFEEFIASEQKELNKPPHNINEQNLFGVRDLSDHILDNAKTPEVLFEAFDKLKIV